MARILVVGAHPDDAEIFAGGVIAKNKGTHIAVVTYGTLGHPITSPEQLRDVREKEARKAAEILGASISFLGYEDGNVRASRELKQSLIELIREIRPNIILTHDPCDNHPDHRETGLAVKDAAFLSQFPLIKTEKAAHLVGNIYTFGFEPFHGTLYIDITEVFDRKMTAIYKHESQLEFSKFIAQQTALQNKVWGARVGVEYAELFLPTFSKALKTFPEFL
jgi:LmbE family N-acetylglucosaminyl deacetylase